MMRRTTKVLAGLAGVSLLLGACGSSNHSSTKSNSGSSNTTAPSSGTTAGGGGGSSSGGSSSGGSSSKGGQPTSLAGYGSMANLVKAAKAEGTLNVITLPKNWANYGTIMSDFTKEYGIKIVDANPEGSSQDEINAMKELKGQSRAPDVLDMGTPFAASAAAAGLLAPYKVQTWNDIPAVAKDPAGDYYADYGGYMAIGYDPSKVKVAPTSYADLEKPIYKNQIGINGNPTEAGAAFSAVYAASLANGGSFSNITPGIQYFKKLKEEGNYVPVTASSETVESGQTPIVIWWDYLQASEIASAVKNWKVVIPKTDAYAGYYDQAISASAPHPAAARLWEEYLYSTVGQNLWLEGEARPIELPTMVKNGTANKAALAKLPPAPPGTIKLPTVAQYNAAETTVSQQWSQVLGS